MYPCRFSAKNCEYNCTEQLYLSSQADFFGKGFIAHQIMISANGLEQKHLSKAIATKIQKHQQWYPIAHRFMFQAVFAKFEQNPELKEFLLATWEDCLVEANFSELYWGIGLTADLAKSMPCSRWPGQNVLGQILMSARAKLQHARTHKGGRASRKSNKQRRKASSFIADEVTN